jgi:proteic killer suppression protein
VKVSFKTARLRKCYQSERDAAREFGELARRYISRINIIYACATVDDLRKLPQLGFHALKGDRAGQFAISLSSNMRLIVSIEESRGETVVCVEEVSKHYD